MTGKARPVDRQLGFGSPHLGVCADVLSLSPVPKSRVPICTPAVPLSLPSVPPDLLLKRSDLRCWEKGGISPRSGVGRVPHMSEVTVHRALPAQKSHPQTFRMGCEPPTLCVPDTEMASHCGVSPSLP